MNQAHNPLIFKGISAIEDAGGIDGFVREVLAESKRLSMQSLHTTGPVGGVDGAKVLLAETMTAVVFRRLDADLQRGFRERVGAAIASCTDERIDAAAERAQTEAEAWSRVVVFGVMDAIQGIGGRDE